MKLMIVCVLLSLPAPLLCFSPETSCNSEGLFFFLKFFGIMI